MQNAPVVIFTGFGRFGDYFFNPTERILRIIGGKIIAGYKIETFVFPAEISSRFAQLVIQEAIMKKAKAIISLGLSSVVNGIRVESSCCNWVDNQKYVHPKNNERTVLCHYSEKEKIKLDQTFYNLKILEGELKNIGIPLEHSQDAGGFCCNALMFSLLKVAQEEGEIFGFAFFHVPCVRECIKPKHAKGKLFLTEQQLLAFVEIFLKSIYEKGEKQ